MSKIVDDRVVEMRFDNKQFEENVKTSISTLDKLKQSLKLPGASKSLEDIDKAAKNMDLKSIATNVEYLQKRFSVFGIMGMRAVENVTDSLFHLAKKTTKFLTGGVINGGITRAMNLENAHFQLQGLLKDEKKVSAVMQNVNDSVDGTAYSLDAAAKVASQFAASGMRAGNEMFKALRGVAGVAAMTNSSYEEVGQIFTTVAGNGRLMGDQLLQLSSKGMNAAATLADYLTKTGKGAKVTESQVREMVSKGQISFKTFAAAMDSAFGEHAKKANDTFTGAMSNVRASLARIGAEFVSPLVVQKGPLVQFFNVLREKINEVKSVIDPFAQTFTSGITAISSAATKALKGADVTKPFKKFEVLSSKWSSFTEKINKAGVSTEKFEKKLKAVAKSHDVDLAAMIEKEGSLDRVMAQGKISKELIIETLQSLSKSQKEVVKSTQSASDRLKYFQKVVDKVWNGDYKNGEARVKALTKAGYNYNEVQRLVNKTVDGHKLKIEDLSKSQLKNIGCTEKEISTIKKLADQAKQTGTPISELISELEKPSGGELLIDTFSNVIQAILKPIRAIRDAWAEIFAPKSSNVLYTVIKNLNKFSKKLIITNSTADKLKRTFKGLFAIIDMISDIVGGGLKLAFKVFCKVLGLANIDILSLTAKMGDAIVRFRDWINSESIFAKVITLIATGIYKAVTAISSFVKKLYELPGVQKGLETCKKGLSKLAKVTIELVGSGISKLSEFVRNLHLLDRINFDNVKKAFVWLKDTIINVFSNIKSLTSKIPDDFTSGFLGGLASGLKKIVKMAIEIAKALLSAIKNVLGIHSPSTAAISIGENIIQGLVIGLRNGIGLVISTAKEIGSALISGFNNIDIGGVIVIGTLIGSLVLLNKTLKQVNTLLAPVKSISAVIGSFTKIMGMVSKYIDAQTWKVKAEAVYTMAKSIVLLAAAIYVLSSVPDMKKLWSAVGAIAVLALIIGGLTAGLALLSKYTGGQDVKAAIKISGVLIGLGVAILLVSKAIATLASLDPDACDHAADLIAGLMSVMVIYTLVSTYMTSDSTAAAKNLLAMAGVIYAIVVLIKLFNGMEQSAIDAAMTNIFGIMGCLLLYTLAIAWISKKCGGQSPDANLIAMGVSIVLIAGAIKLLADIPEDKLYRASDVIYGLIFMVGLYGVLMARVNKGAGFSAAGTIMAMGGSMMLIALAVRMIAGIPVDGIIKAGLVVLAVEGLFIAMVWVMSKIEKVGTLKSPASAILAMGASMALIAIALKIIATMSEEDIIKGMGVVTGIGALFIAIAIATSRVGKNANQIGGVFLKMSIAILILVGAIALIGLLDPADVVLGTLVISMLMGMFAVVAASTKYVNNCMGTLIVITVAIGVLAGALYMLSKLDPEKVVNATECLAVIMAVFAMVMQSTKNVKASVPTILSMVAVIAILGTVLILLAQAPVDQSVGAAIALSILMVVMTKVMQQMSLMSGVSLQAIGCMALMVVIVGMLAGVLGLLAYFDVAPSLETALAISVLLIAMAAALNVATVAGAAAPAAAIGMALILAFVVALGALAVGIGALFNEFPTLENALDKGIEIAGKIGQFIGAFLGGLGAGIINQLTGSLVPLGYALSEFMDSMSGFIEGAKGIDEGTANGIKALSQAVLYITAGDFISKLTDWAFGEEDFESFGESLKPLATGLKEFTNEMDGVNVDAVKKGADAANALAAIDITRVGGFVGAICGEKNLGTFGDNITDLGIGLKSFATETADIRLESIQTAAKAASALASIKITKSGGFLGWLTGDNSLGNFGDNIEDFGESLKNYSDSLKDVDISAISSATTAVDKFASLVNKMGSMKEENVDKFQKVINKMSELDADGAVSTLKSTAKNLSSATNAMVGSVSKGLSGGKSQITSSASSMVSGITSAVTSKTGSMSAAGTHLANALNKGFSSKIGAIKRAASSAASDAASAIRSHHSSFSSAGNYLGDGLVNGIAAKESAAYAAGYALGQRAAQGEKDGQKSKSPSKLTYQNGIWFGEGLVNGISAMGTAVYKAGYSMGDMATQATRAALTQVDTLLSTIDSDMDTQPTIRPVMDLSDVRRGADAIGGMFNSSIPLSASANLGAISSSMDRRGQNGFSGEVIDAINKLRSDLGNINTNTYTINGITYDDGSNVSSAVETLVRAAKIERRI